MAARSNGILVIGIDLLEKANDMTKNFAMNDI